jgi:dsDNA-binding SOS-regulon protein
MSGVPRQLIEHSLNVDPNATTKRQHLRRFTDDRRNAIKKELAKLLTPGFIREVFHPEWLANPVLVRKKSSNKWRMCVDYTDLNKHCPKDPFGLPRIDQVIDSTAGCDLLCFLDCYSGYHQITIKEEDQEKTAFITPFGAYCYMTMSFGLKNAGATYQRAIQACFKRQLNKNIEAYVDDMVIKTRNSDTLITDLEDTFASLREYRWKLNPNMCVFGVPSGKLLSFIISHRGIEDNPEKISTITNIKAPTCIKDVQKLTGCMAALNRFISKLGERGLPFFKLLKHQEKFAWTLEADQALAQLKDFLSKPPVLTAPRKKEQLLLYLAATTHVVSTAIVVKQQEDGHAYPVQRPVYFVSEVLSESKARYQPVQKLLDAVLITLRKLRHYFQEYSISVVTDYPLGDILRTKMLLEESPSGQSNSVPSTSTSSHEQPSSCRL